MDLPRPRALCIAAGLALSIGAFDASTTAARQSGSKARLFVVWATGGLPPRVGPALKSVDGVRVVTPARLGIAWLTGSRRAGETHDDPPAGYGFPMEVVVVSPGPFSRFAPTEDRPELRALQHGEALISRTASKVRGAERLNLRMQGRRVTARGGISDRAAHGVELVLRKPVPGWVGNTIRYFLVRADANTSRRELRGAVKRAAGEGTAVQIRSDGQARFLRHAPNVKPLFAFKRSFGEFPARPAENGALSMFPKWVDRHIRARSVPLLGNVRCHRKLFPMLRGALGEIRDKGLGHLIRPQEYAGCYYPRYVADPPGVRLSRHTWGIALDINTSGNAFGQEPQQDRRVVRIFREWGFLWGGTWPTPDGMHFEWERFPG